MESLLGTNTNESTKGLCHPQSYLFFLAFPQDNSIKYGKLIVPTDFAQRPMLTFCFASHSSSPIIPNGVLFGGFCLFLFS
jgi:hypothetical protein